MSRFLASTHSEDMKMLFLACVVMVAVTAMACSSKDAVLSFGQGGHVGSGGSGTGATAGRNGAGTGGAGATGGKAACETAECFAPYECVRSCGGPVEYSGCCACVPPLVNRATIDCAGTGGTTGGTGGAGATGGQAGCETAQCLRTYECVRSCWGPIEYSGCCACVPPLVDQATIDCAGTGGTTGSGGAASGGAGGRAASGGAGGRGSGGAGGVPGTGGGPPTDGGTDARLCEMVQCTRPYECVRSCGGPIEYTGCCTCEAPLFDNYNGIGCRGTGGASGAGGAGGASGTGGAGGSSCAQLRTSYAAALPTAKKCNVTIDRPPCLTSVSSVLGCSCKTYVDNVVPLQPYIDAWNQAGCMLACTAIACINAQPGLCDTTASPSPDVGTCRDTSP